jgi:glycosyltransferase involved in cell wall biosynthesis
MSWFGGDGVRQHTYVFPGWWWPLLHFRPHVVHLDEEAYSLSTFQFALFGKRLRARVTFCSAQNLLKRVPVPFRWTERVVLRLADGAQARSEAAQQVLRSKGFRAPVHVIGHSVDVSLFAPGSERALRDALGVVGAVILYVGRLSAEKGVEDLVRAFARLRAGGREVTLLILGSGPLESQVRSVATDLGVADRIRMIPPVPHVSIPRYYRCADVVVVPSRTTARIAEQFGRVVIEALSCGRPVIGSSAGEVPALIARTGGGWVYPEGDIEALAVRLDQVLGDQRGREEVGCRGRASVLEHYSTQAEAGALRRLFEAVVDPVSADPHPTAGGDGA